MRAEAHPLERASPVETIDQHQVGLNLAVAMVGPFAGQSMIAQTRGERAIRGQLFESGLLGRLGAFGIDLPLDISSGADT